MPARRGHRRPGGPIRGGRAGSLDPLHAGPRQAGGLPTRVLVDGRNVQHALARAAGSANLPTTALIARLRAAFSPPTEVELILDGHPAGSPWGRVAPGLSVVFTRGATADEAIGVRVREALQALGAAGAWTVLVVTDDREVRDHARRSGVRVEGTAWLLGRLPAGPSLGNVAPRGAKG